MTYQTLSLGGIALTIPATDRNVHCSVDDKVVRGRWANTLSGGLLPLGVLYKREWTISFYPRDDEALIRALIGTQTTFVDHNGTTHNVWVIGEPKHSPYPHSEIGLMTFVLREV